MVTTGLVEPQVSIIIPSFNREEFVAATLDSVCSQTRQDWECIVVDDGSTDRTKEIVRKYALQNSRIKLYDRNREPKGACTCRNIGVSLSSGEYLIFLDTDDLLEPFCIENRVAVMKSDNECEFAIFPSLLFESEPNDLGLWWNIDKSTPEILRQLYQDAICQGTGVIWKKSSFLKIGQWDETLHLWQDIDLFLRAYLEGLNYSKHFDLPPDLQVRRLESSLSRKDVFNLEKQKSRIVVVKKAAELMKRRDKSQYLPEIKYMVAEVISSLVRSNMVALADDLIEWSFHKSIFNRHERDLLRVYRWMHRLRLAKINVLHNWLNVSMEVFSAQESTLGKIQWHEAS